MKRNIAILLSIFSLLLLGACGPAQPTSVKVVISLPLDEDFGISMLNAIHMAHEEAGGRVGDVTVELLEYNSNNPNLPNNPSRETEIAQEIISDTSVIAFLGSTSSSKARGILPILNEASIALVSPSATWPGLTKAGYEVGEPGIYYPTGQRNFFRMVPADDIQGVGAAQWIANQGYSRVFIATMDVTYSLGLSAILEANASDLGLSIVGREVFDTLTITDEEIAAIVEQVIATDAEVLYFPISTGAAARSFALPQAALLANPDLVVIGADAMPQETLPDDTSSIEGIYATVFSVPVDAAGDFISRYEERFGSRPGEYTIVGYEAIKVILDAIGRAETPTREGVLAALHATENYSGVLGTWSFDANGDTTLRAISMLQLHDGVWETVDVVR